MAQTGHTTLPAAAAEGDPAADSDAYASRGADTCLKCHDDYPTMHILKTPHAMRSDARTPFSSYDCETCHGPSPEHLVKPAEGEKRALTSITFSRGTPNTVEELNGVCLGCHESGMRINWKGSPHEFSGRACTDCHDVHTPGDRVLEKETQPKVCFGCHKAQQAQFLRQSRHPVRDGLLACTDCHNPHGTSGPKQLIKATVNETCYTCHAEKRGPFLWEHAPVRDDCTICHTPHGSNQARLLKIRTPWLCQQCHLVQFHPSTAYSGTGVPPAGAAQQILAKGCLNCHSQIHGSNHPAGVRLTR